MAFGIGLFYPHYTCVSVCVLFTTEQFLEVAIESWPEWDLNP